jgi:hypothetical protein
LIVVVVDEPIERHEPGPSVATPRSVPCGRLIKAEVVTITPDNRKLFESLGVDAVHTDLLGAFEGNQRIPPGPGRQQALD